MIDGCKHEANALTELAALVVMFMTELYPTAVDQLEKYNGVLAIQFLQSILTDTMVYNSHLQYITLT